MKTGDLSRREFVALVGAGLAASSVAAQAEVLKPACVKFLTI